MIRHYDEGVGFHLGRMLRDSQPAVIDDGSQVVQMHLAVIYVAQDVAAIAGADCDEVRAIGCVIERAQSYGSAVMNFGIEMQVRNLSGGTQCPNAQNHN